ncbi:MAG: helix-turn-helix transcriptional regulator [Pseudobdellovibrionaceae bacterium]
MRELDLIAHNVRKYRKLAKMTQEDLSEKTGLDRKFLSEVENAKKNLTVGSLAKITAALHIKVRDLFSEEI